MPRIDPIQLLNCLSVLLSPDGGIKSRDEVQRLAKLMTKFSKKLVSKCIYIQILKCTETELLGLFMGSGGWRLVHMWLTESIVAKNWPLVRELLELLLLCPVDIERLKTNNCPKLVKELSKDGNHLDIRALASKLVEQWLKTVKGENVSPVRAPEILQIISDAQSHLTPEFSKSDSNFDEEVLEENNLNQSEIKSDRSPELNESADIDEHTSQKEENKEPEMLPVLKITVKDGKQILSQVDENEIKTSDKNKDRSKSKSKDRLHDRSSSSSRSSYKHSSRSHSSSSDKHKSSHKERSKDKGSSHSSRSKEKESHDSKKSSERSKSSSSKSKDERSSKSKPDKEKTNDDKIKESTQKSIIERIADKTSIKKLGKIPKLSDVKKEKPSISIEVRKPDDPKPKTVKTFHSKFRKHGLEEEVKPPPSRATLLSNKKAPPALPPTVSIPKRPSPVYNEHPPEKKPKTLEIVEKPGSIKLIPPKPKPTMLQESDMFMDALNASATVKKEPKKRKRRTSGSKDGNASGDSSPPQTPTTPSASSPNSEKSVPPRFYQDTLVTEEDKEKIELNESRSPADDDNEENISNKMDTSEPHTLTVNGLKGVLCYHKKKGPKKSIKWKSDSELEEIQYFELDETERVNVTKTFTDMKYLERTHEREQFEKARNLPNDDVMEEKTIWRPLIPIDTEGQVHVEYGKNSKEKEIQTVRQKGTLQALYFHKAMIPDTAQDPEPETHPYSEPNIIPLEDVTGNQDNISDFRNMPWPEPKGNPPPASNNVNMPTMFPPNMAQFPSGFPTPQFPVVPGLPPNMMPQDWQNGVPPMLPNGMPNAMPPNAIAAGSMPPGNMPGMMIPPENMMMEMFGAPNPMFGMPPEGFNMPQGMFPPDFMNGPQGPLGPDGFSGAGNFRGAMRGRGAGGHWRGKNAGNWDGPQRGRGGNARGGGSNRKAMCIYFQRKGSCRQGDNCTFLHPGVNFPF